MASHRSPGRAASSRDHRANVVEKRRRVLIVCEGKESEPNYFQAIIDFYRLNGRVIDGHPLDLTVQGAARNTLSLIAYAEEQRGSGVGRYDEVWCVFDKDDFRDEDFDNAIQKAKQSKFLHAAWSNEAFELWYVLHFEYHHVSTASRGKVRRSYIERLHVLMEQHCGKSEYAKNDKGMYVLLGEERLAVAIANAKRLLTLYKASEPYHAWKPATTVHELVAMLLKYAPLATYQR